MGSTLGRRPRARNSAAPPGARVCRRDHGHIFEALEARRTSEERQSPRAAPPSAGRAGNDLDLGHDLGHEGEGDEWTAARPRNIPPEQWHRFEGYVQEVFNALGMSTTGEEGV